MDWTQILNQIFQLCVIPLLGVIGGFLVNLIKKKSIEIQEKTKSDLADKYIAKLEKLVTSCVETTNQTYVDELKRLGTFDKEAQKIAFNKTYATVSSLVTGDTKKILEDAYTDFPALLTTMIESVVKNKK